jgi:predicted nucleic acid-binding protein
VILADTSAWVEFDRATGSTADLRVTDLLSTGGPLAVTEPVLMEVLAGARDGRGAEPLRALLMRCELLPFESGVDFEGAARIYRRCRAAGITPSGTIDCMIAAVALRSGASLLSSDADLQRIGALIGVTVEPA